MSDAGGMASGPARRVRPVARVFYDRAYLIVTICVGVLAAFVTGLVPWLRWTSDEEIRRALSLNPGAEDRISEFGKALLLPDDWTMKWLSLATTPLCVATGVFVGLLIGKLMYVYAGRRVDALAESLLNKRSAWTVRTDLDLLLPGPWLMGVPALLIAASAFQGSPVFPLFYLMPFTFGYFVSIYSLRPIYRMIIARADEIAAAEAAAAAQKA